MLVPRIDRRLSHILALTLAAAPLGLGCNGGESGVMDDDGDGDGMPDDDPFPDDPFPGEDVCARVNVGTNGVTPTVSLLIDQSSSMTADFANTRRWEAVYQTLMAPNGIVKRLEGEVRFGLNLYTSINGFANGGTCPLLSTVNPAINNFAAMDAVFAPARPVEDTPTAESIAAVTEQLRNVTEPGPKIIILGTDGLPDTCDKPDPEEGQAVTVAAAQAAFAAGIRTFVISVGDDVGEEHLEDMANAGVGLDPAGTEQAEYWVALNADSLVNAFDQIIGGVSGCQFTLEGEVDRSREADGKVALDGRELEVGSDWRLVDGKTIEILGAACDAIQSGDDHQVAAVFPCGAIIVN
jgi:hypothetical protein